MTAELLWYVLPMMTQLFAEISRVLKRGGHYLIIQQFYQPGQQKYGSKIMQTPEDLLRMLPFRTLHQMDIERMSNHKFVVLADKTP